MNKTFFPFGCLPNPCPHLEENSEALYEELRNQFAEIDRQPKNILHYAAYDMDTYQGLPNLIPGTEHRVRIIDGVRVDFDDYLPYTDIIYSTESGQYCYDYAYVYKGKLIAIGKDRGRCGGLTDILYKEKNAKEIVAKLSESSEKDSRLLYEKIKDMEIATPEELPEPPKLVYRIADNSGNNYYINDNQDRTYTLWLVNTEEYNGAELITTPNLDAVKQRLFTLMIMDIEKAKIKTYGTKD